MSQRPTTRSAPGRQPPCGDPALDRIADIIQAMAGSLQPRQMPAVDVADLQAVLGEDPGRVIVGIGTTRPGEDPEQATLRALQDLTAQRQRQEAPPDNGPGANQP